MQVESDLEGGLDIENDCLHGYLRFLQVPSYQIEESSLCDPDMTIELLMQIQTVNLRIYRMEISGIQINNDGELQNIINSANNGQYRGKIKKQIVKEFEIVDGYPVLDEYEHTGMDRGGEDHNQNRI